MKQTILVNEDMVNEIQMKDATEQSMKSTIAAYLETHALDETDKALSSPVFVSYQKKAAEAGIEFRKAKDAMIADLFSAEERARGINWSLDYDSCTLTYSFAK